ncbi:glycoside hydrolase family 15 protein [Caldicellulosiruptoraceae bacterium PP1]
MKKPYLIEAIIGNSKSLAQIDQNGIMQRYYWPSIDYFQQIKLLLPAVYNDGLIFFEDIKLKKEAQYVDDFAYQVKYSLGNKEIKQTDFIDFTSDSIVRCWEADFDDFFVFFEPMINEHKNFNAAYFDKQNDLCFVYLHNTIAAITFENGIKSFTLAEGIKDAKDCILEGIEEITRPQIALKAKKSERYVLYITFGNSKDEVIRKINKLRKMGYESIYQDNVTYWEYRFNRLNLNVATDESINSIVKRSAYVFYLLQNRETGGIIAAPEFDEEFSKCGGYGFSWGRDAAFITVSMDKLGMHDEVEKFYNFKFSCQEADGSWNQRYWTDGTLAPSWGIQIDETASIIWGFIKHCEENEKYHLIEKYKKNLQKAIEFLLKNIDEQKGLILKSFDLWEERQGIHLYSNAAIYAALEVAKRYFFELTLEIEIKIKALVSQTFTRFILNEQNIYARTVDMRVSKELYNLLDNDNRYLEPDDKYNIIKYYQKVDNVMDASIIGAFYPFMMIENNEVLENTIKNIETSCTSSFSGGIKRYANDTYAGGNPWIITTLWLAIYYKKVGNIERANELFNWAFKHAQKNGLLPEQIDKLTGQSAWVVPLAWSHAMFVLYLYE